MVNINEGFDAEEQLTQLRDELAVVEESLAQFQQKLPTARPDEVESIREEIYWAQNDVERLTMRINRLKRRWNLK